jgi:hypothetical protein
VIKIYKLNRRKYMYFFTNVNRWHPVCFLFLPSLLELNCTHVQRRELCLGFLPRTVMLCQSPSRCDLSRMRRVDQPLQVHNFPKNAGAWFIFLYGHVFELQMRRPYVKPAVIVLDYGRRRRCVWRPRRASILIMLLYFLLFKYDMEGW